MDIILLVIGIIAIVFGCLYYMDRKHDREVIDIVVEFLEHSIKDVDYITISSYLYGYSIEGWYKNRRYDINWDSDGMSVIMSYKYESKLLNSEKTPQTKCRFEVSDRKNFKRVRELMYLYDRRHIYMDDEIIQDDVEIEKLRYTGENAKEQLIKDIIKELK